MSRHRRVTPGRTRVTHPLPLHHATRYGLHLRPITDDDMGFLTALYRSTREGRIEPCFRGPRPTNRPLSRCSSPPSTAITRKHYPDALWLVIEQAGRPIGRLYLERWGSEHRIIDIALMPEARGRGIGHAVLQDVMDEAARAGKTGRHSRGKDQPRHGRSIIGWGFSGPRTRAFTT